MATRAQKIKVGIFVLVGTALTVLVFIAIALEGRQPRDTYYITFAEGVGGLQRDAAVLYQGVPVGKVENIRVTEENEVVVQVGIETNTVTLHRGVKAKLGLGNLMGSLVVELSGGDLKAPELKPGARILSESSLLENLAKDIPAILDDIKELLASLNQTLGGDTPAQLNSLVKNADGALVEARELIANLNRGLGGETPDRIRSMVGNADTTMGSLKESAAALDGLISQVKRDIYDYSYLLKESIESFNRSMLESSETMQYFRNHPSSLMWGKEKPQDPYVR